MYGLGLVGLGISLALGWKKPDESGYYGLLAGLIKTALDALAWIILMYKAR